MALQVVAGAQMSCSFGTSPASLAVLPANRTQSSQQFSATIQDYVPMLNIPPFGMCQSLMNPQVAAATTAALGVLTPQPCMPMTTQPWTPGVLKILINQQPALDNTSTCLCQWGGLVSILSAGQVKEQVP
jgi:hypothetical protein